MTESLLDKVNKRINRYFKNELATNEIDEEMEKTSTVMKVEIEREVEKYPLGRFSVEEKENGRTITIFIPETLLPLKAQLLNYNYKSACDSCANLPIKIGLTHFLIELFRKNFSLDLSIHEKNNLFNCLLEKYFNDSRYFSDTEFRNILNVIRKFLREKDLGSMHDKITFLLSTPEINSIKDKYPYISQLVNLIVEQEEIYPLIEEIYQKKRDAWQEISDDELNTLLRRKMTKTFLEGDKKEAKKLMKTHKDFIKWAFMIVEIGRNDATEEDIRSVSKEQTQSLNIQEFEEPIEEEISNQPCFLIGSFGNYKFYNYTEKSYAVTGDKADIEKAQRSLSKKLGIDLRFMKSSSAKQCVFSDEYLMFLPKKKTDTKLLQRELFSLSKPQLQSACPHIRDYGPYSLFNNMGKNIIISADNIDLLREIQEPLNIEMNEKFNIRIFPKLKDCKTGSPGIIISNRNMQKLFNFFEKMNF